LNRQPEATVDSRLFPTLTQGTWTYTATSGECGPLSNNKLGTVNIVQRWDPSLLTGWGKRGDNWQAAVSLNHELRPGVGLAAGYFRTSYGNFRVTQNIAVSPTNYDQFCITAPVDARLPGGGGNQLCGLYDVKPAFFGQVNNLITSAAQFGNPSEVYNGFELGMRARFGRGAFLSGGVSSGRTVTDNCFILNSPQDLRYCRQVLPFEGQTQVKVSGAYPLPWNFMASAVFQSLSGIPNSANFTATNAQIAPTFGRNLAACGAAAVCTATVTAPIVEPNTLFEDRLNQTDLRFTRSVQLGRTRVFGSFDIYNLFNTGAIESDNGTYGKQWLLPTFILPGRLFEFSARLEF
jgi:hypothetical protein